jgi:hypothetical protein
MMTFSVSPMTWNVTYINEDGDAVIVASVTKVNGRVWINFQDEDIVFESLDEFTNLMDCLSVVVKNVFKDAEK